MLVPAANPGRREHRCDANVSLSCPRPCPSEFLSKARVLLGPPCACPAMRDCTHPQRGDAAATALVLAPGGCWWLSHRTSIARHAELQPQALRTRGAPRVAAVPRIPRRPRLRHGLLVPSNCNPGPPGTYGSKGEGRQDQHPAGTHSGGGVLWEGATRLSGFNSRDHWSRGDGGDIGGSRRETRRCGKLGGCHRGRRDWETPGHRGGRH